MNESKRAVLMVVLLLSACAISNSTTSIAPGVVLGPGSSIALSFDWSHASYLPEQPACSAEYLAIIAVDQQMTRTVDIEFGNSTKLNTEYLLRPQPQCCGIVITNFLVGDSDNIQVNINGIDVPDGADNVSMGSIRFQSLRGHLEFDFSFSFSDGKVLQGTFNLPIKEDLVCPGPR